MNKDIISKVAGVAWNNNRVDTGLASSKLAAQMPEWDEVVEKAKAGNPYLKYMVDEQIAQTEKILNAYFFVQSKIIECGMENVIDRQVERP